MKSGCLARARGSADEQQSVGTLGGSPQGLQDPGGQLQRVERLGGRRGEHPQDDFLHAVVGRDRRHPQLDVRRAEALEIDLSILRLAPPKARVTAKTLQFNEIDLLASTERQMLKVRGRRISMIMQDPKFALDPVMRVGDQIAEAIPADRRGSRAQDRERVLAMLDSVHIRDPKRVFELYPHEVSGGMGQRIMIAMMLMPEPSLLIADEPTSALDVTVRLRVLAILDELAAQRDLGLICKTMFSCCLNDLGEIDFVWSFSLLFFERGNFNRIGRGEIGRERKVQCAVMPVDQMNRFFEHRHHAESEQIDFYDLHVGAIVFIPLHDHASRH